MSMHVSVRQWLSGSPTHWKWVFPQLHGHPGGRALRHTPREGLQRHPGREGGEQQRPQAQGWPGKSLHVFTCESCSLGRDLWVRLPFPGSCVGLWRVPLGQDTGTAQRSRLQGIHVMLKPHKAQGSGSKGSSLPAAAPPGRVLITQILAPIRTPDAKGHRVGGPCMQAAWRAPKHPRL